MKLHWVNPPIHLGSHNTEEVLHYTCELVSSAGRNATLLHAVTSVMKPEAVIKVFKHGTNSKA